MRSGTPGRLPLEAFVLTEFQPAGHVLGYLAGRSIHATITDGFGRRYFFAGVASRCESGGFAFDRLTTGEWIVEPGLIYRAAAATFAEPHRLPNGQTRDSLFGLLWRRLVCWGRD
jgi:hypothetical protein